MTELRNFGIVGKAGAGKDTLANFLVESYGYYRRAWADELKERVGRGLRPELSPTEARLWADATKTHPEMRGLLQHFGTAARELVDPEYWITALFDHLRDLEYDGPVVVPDCRFINEASTLKDRGFVIVKIVRDEGQNARGLTASQRQHASEVELDKIIPDLVIYNNWSIEELYQNARVVLELEEPMEDAISRGAIQKGKPIPWGTGLPQPVNRSDVVRTRNHRLNVAARQYLRGDSGTDATLTRKGNRSDG